MKRLLFIMTIMLCLTIVSGAEGELGIYKAGECIDLVQLCSTCTYNNLTSVIIKDDKGNNTRIEIWENMEKRGVEFNYTYCNTNQTGTYNINGHGDIQGTDTVWAYKLKITPSGEEPDSAKSTIYISMFFGLLIFFAISLIGLFKTEDYKGKFALYWVTHLLFVAITFTGWTMSAEFLTNVVFMAGMFRILFWISIISMLPMILLSVAWIVYIHTFNEHFERMISKGEDPETAFGRASKKSGGWLSGK